jgi:hypothetical protein
MPYLTKEEIVAKVVADLQEDDKKFLTEEVKSEDQMSMFHHTVGRHIRNHYGLWEKDNPLVKAWYDAAEVNDITYLVSGVDTHPNHPDQVSNQILRAVWREVNKPHDLLSLVDKK